MKELIIFLKELKKKVTVICRSKNYTSFANYLNKMCNLINIFELDEFNTSLYPDISILEIDGLANTLVLKQIEKFASYVDSDSLGGNI